MSKPFEVQTQTTACSQLVPKSVVLRVQLREYVTSLGEEGHNPWGRLPSEPGRSNYWQIGDLPHDLPQQKPTWIVGWHPDRPRQGLAHRYREHLRAMRPYGTGVASALSGIGTGVLLFFFSPFGVSDFCRSFVPATS